ncbi:MAG: amidase family protein [Alphaproteobacteria bacterium]
MKDEWHDLTATELGKSIARREIGPVKLTQHFLVRIKTLDTDCRVYLRTTEERALAEAEAAEVRVKQGTLRSPLDGVPISWKDLYDTAGIATEGGTPLLAGRVPEHDAVVLARAARAGLICLGKTNTVQFALGGIGTNPYTGTPPNAVMKDVPRAPGGSSCGAAVSVAAGMAAAGIGSDTGGSVRIPAAWNSLVGFKTSVGALPVQGVLPLSPSFDTVGPLTHSVADAAALFAIMGARPSVDLAGTSTARLRLLVAESFVWDHAEPNIEEPIRDVIAQLHEAGAIIDYSPVPEFEEITAVVKRHGGVVLAEAYTCWKNLIDTQGDLIDPSVRFRFHQGRDMSACDVETVRAAIRNITPKLYQRMAGYDALIAPTIPIAPPPIAEVEGDIDKYRIANGYALRNTQLGNLLACCALTLPVRCSPTPAGLMIMAPSGEDDRLLRVGKAIESTIGFVRGGQV